MVKINNHYAKFLIKGIIILFVLFVSDRVTGFLLSKIYFSQKSGLHYCTTNAMEKTEADVLIFGSSRANHHYHPQVFEDSLKMSYYNAGRNGMGIFYSSAILKSVLKRYKPKIIILDIIESEFAKSVKSYDRISALLPYYSKHPEIRDIIKVRSKFEIYKLYSKVYPYNSTFITMLAGNMSLNQSRKKDFKGFIPLTINNSLKRDIKWKVKNDNYEILDSLKIFYYENFLKEAKEKDIKVYVIISPYLTDSYEKNSSIEIAEEIAKKYEISLIDFRYSKNLSDNVNYFYDSEHLNESGSIYFSNRLIEEIRNKKSI